MQYTHRDTSYCSKEIHELHKSTAPLCCQLYEGASSLPGQGVQASNQ